MKEQRQSCGTAVARNKVVLQRKRMQEKTTVETMICLYCKGNHHADQVPCAECRTLIDYAHERIDRCPRMEEKTFCSSCETPCYKSIMRERIKTAMAYAGPRMLLHDPIGAVRHLLQGRLRS